MSDEPENIIAGIRIQHFVAEFLVFTDAQEDDPARSDKFAAFINTAIGDSQEDWGDITLSMPELVRIRESRVSIQVEREDATQR